MSGKVNPSFMLIARLTSAIERQVGFHIDPRDLISEYGEFLTPYMCDLAKCRGCLPEVAIDRFGIRDPKFEGIVPGQWVTSIYPRGFPKGRS